MTFLQLVLSVILITQTFGDNGNIVFPGTSDDYDKLSSVYKEYLEKLKIQNNYNNNNNHNNNFNKKPVGKENVSTDASNNNFDWNLIKAILKKENKNTIISPYSVKLILSILGKAIPKNKESRNELSVVMPNLRSENDEYNYFTKTLQSLQEENENIHVSLASNIYLDESYRNSINKDYVNLAKRNYNTNLNIVNFNKSQETTDLINEQVDKSTRGHIQNFIEPSSLTDIKALFLNAIYFEALWENEFPTLPPEVKLSFSISQNEKVKTECMSGDPEAMYSFDKSQELNSKIIRLGYKGDKFAMYIILPNEIDGLDSVIHILNNNTISLAQSKMTKRNVHLILPKFSIDYSVKLKQVLEQLGIKKIFDSDANLNYISPENDNLAVSEVLQKSKITINEKGTIAAGVTSAAIFQKTISAESFIAKRPFLFFIQDESTGALLFTGKFVKP